MGKLWLSSSKIQTYDNCSALYCAKYLLFLPDKSNDGARRGSVVHDVLEIFLNKRHYKRYKEIVKNETCKDTKSVWKLITKIAEKYKVNNNDNLELIDQFILVAFNNNFYGNKNVFKIEGEKEFNISVDDGELRFNIRGFIDKTFFIKNKSGLIVHVTDYKTNKQRFDNEKLEQNTQNFMYQLVMKKLYPEYKRKFDFLFLKFKKNPLQSPPEINDLVLEGFEYKLTELQNVLEKFTVKNATDRLAAFDEKNSWLCGRGSFRCSARDPLDYFIHIKSNGDKKGYFTKEEIKLENGDKIESARYFGCPVWFNERGQPRNLQ